MTKPMMWLLAVVASASSPAFAREVFRTADENGVVSFSDVASPRAEAIELATDPVPDDWIERQQHLIEQQLAVAKALEESRLAREAARARRLEVLAAAEPPALQPVLARTYVGGVVHRHCYFGHPAGAGRPWRSDRWGPHPRRPIEPLPDTGQGGRGRLDPPSRPVPLPPLEPR